MTPRPAHPSTIKALPPEAVGIEEGRGSARPYPPPPKRRRRWQFWKKPKRD